MLKAQIKTLKILLIFSDARCLSQTNTSRTFFKYQKQLVTFYMGRQFFFNNCCSQFNNFFLQNLQQTYRAWPG